MTKKEPFLQFNSPFLSKNMNKEYRAIVISGGAVKSIAALGALHWFTSNSLLDVAKVEIFAGTSAGSIICALLVCGYTPWEIYCEIYNTEENIFPIGLENFTQFFTRYGFLSFDKLSKKIEAMILLKFSFIPTLGYIYRETRKKLIIPVVNVSKMTVEYFDHESQPDLSVLEAILISCNLPLIFHSRKLDQNYYVDGGLIDNFPIDRIDRDIPTIGVLTLGSRTEKRELSIVEYIFRLLLVPIENRSRNRFIRENNRIVVRMQLSTEIFDLNPDKKRKSELFSFGFVSAEFEASKKRFYIEGLD